MPDLGHSATLTTIYALRRPYAAYAGDCLRVRRSSDSTEDDIGFDANGYLDVAALLTFVGAGSGYVTKLYDLSGNGFHLDLSKTDSWPRIVNAGVLQRHDSRLCWKFDGTDDVLAQVSYDLSGTGEVSMIAGLGNIAGNDKAILHTYSDVSNHKGVTLLTNGSARLRCGLTHASSTFNLWDRNTLLDITRTVFGCIADKSLDATNEAKPFFNHLLGTTGFTQVLNDNGSGNFESRPLGMGAIWDGAAGATTSAGALSFDFAFLTKEALSEAECQTIAEYFGHAAEGVIIGDSTVAAFDGETAIQDFVYTDEESVTRNGMAGLADPGDTIAQQKTAWTNFPQKLLVDWVLVQIGLNDMDPAVATATTIAALQDLIDTIRTGVSASCKIIGCTMTPAWNRWDDVGFDPEDAQAKWVAVNDAIMNRGGSPITDLDYRLEQHTLDLSMDVSGNAALHTDYDTGDGIHPNDAGREIVAENWRNALIALGFIEGAGGVNRRRRLLMGAT